VISLALAIAVSTIVVATWLTGRQPAAAPAGPAALRRSGTVSGEILPCGNSQTPPPPSQGGVVKVLRGYARSTNTLVIGARLFVLPAAVVATARIGPGQRFSFRLAPGHYVLLARFRDGGHLALAFSRDGRVVRMPYTQAGPAEQFWGLSVTAGSRQFAAIPSGCM